MSSTSASLPSADWVLRGLDRRRAACVEQVVREARLIGGYADLHPREIADLQEHIGEGLDAVIRAIAEQRPLGEDDVPFLWPHIYRRTIAGVPEADMLAVVRIFQRVLWDAILELAQESRDDREAALTLARPLLGFIDVLSDTVNKAYLEAGTESHGAQARRELLELLLGGSPPAPGPTLGAARTLGLLGDTPLLVIVGRPAPTVPTPQAAELAVAARLLARAAGRAIEPLGAERHGEAIVVLGADQRDTERIVERITAEHARLAQRGLALTVGISTLHDGLAATAAAYAEACLAVEQARRRNDGVLALSGLDVHEYLILRAGDRIAWRLVPAPVRAFIEADAAQGGALADTLLAYVERDLSVKLAAEKLYVHPNTVHYRLAKVETQTELEMRRLRDVQLVATAVHLHRGGHAG